MGCRKACVQEADCLGVGWVRAKLELVLLQSLILGSQHHVLLYQG